MTQGTKTALGAGVAILLILTALYALNTNNEARYPETATSTEQVGTSTSPLNNSDGSGAAGGTVPAGRTNAEECRAVGGTWSEQYKECTGISQNSCQEIGGRFNECASACRHNPNAEACIMMCVEVCTLK